MNGRPKTVTPLAREPDRTATPIAPTLQRRRHERSRGSFVSIKIGEALAGRGDGVTDLPPSTTEIDNHRIEVHSSFRQTSTEDLAPTLDIADRQTPRADPHPVRAPPARGIRLPAQSPAQHS